MTSVACMPCRRFGTKCYTDENTYIYVLFGEVGHQYPEEALEGDSRQLKRADEKKRKPGWQKAASL